MTAWKDISEINIPLEIQTPLTVCQYDRLIFIIADITVLCVSVFWTSICTVMFHALSPMSLGYEACTCMGIQIYLFIYLLRDVLDTFPSLLLCAYEIIQLKVEKSSC